MSKFYVVLCVALLVNISQAFGSEAGMPQLNPEFWTAQIFWLILIFLSLYLVIWKIFLPKITYSIENRKSKIVNDLDEAQKLKINAEKKVKEYNAIIENSNKEAKKIRLQRSVFAYVSHFSQKNYFNYEYTGDDCIVMLRWN